MLVTGGCGFIGSNFIRYLLTESEFSGRVINLDKLTYSGKPQNLADIAAEFSERYVFVQRDICDEVMLADVFQRFEIDIVCHFAAESHVDRSIIAPDAFIRTNINGTFYLLEQARLNSVKLFHHISTDEVYGSLGSEGYFTETTAYRPNSPYSASKAASDHLVRAYFKTYGLPVTITNCSNNYGPYQFPEKLIPLIILNGLAGKPLPVYGDGKNIRDWLYVRDHCIAIWMVMKHGSRGETYNIGGNCEKCNLEVVERICQILDRIQPAARPHNELITFVNDRPGHDFRYAIDSNKIQSQLGWTPQETFETGLEKTVRWYLKHHDTL